MGYDGKLEKLKISAFEKSNFTGTPETYLVYINPEKYTRQCEIVYCDPQAQGSSGGSPEFSKVKSDVVSLQLVFDGTGAVPGPVPGVSPFTDDGITEQIEAFMAAVFNFDGQIHSPKFLELSWGTLVFRCRLKSLSITYTLFKPDGTPLRARAETSFVQYADKDELARRANTSSPDLSHLVTVAAGDTLPLLCARIYGSSVYYAKVAMDNGLTDFMVLEPGSRLLFRPLRGASR